MGDKKGNENFSKTIWLISVVLIVIIAIVAIFFVLQGGNSPDLNNQSKTVSESAVSGQASQENNDETSLSKIDCQINLDDFSISNQNGVSLTDKKISINKAGTYKIRGTATDGQIYIKASDDDKVILYMDGASISNEKESPIYVENVGKLYLQSDSTKTNKIKAGYASSDPIDLIQGFNKKNTNKESMVSAIYSKDDIKIKSGIYEIEASGDGIHANDDFGIKGGQVTINAGDDGIHANKSFLISDGQINIEQSYEGIESNQITIENGKINIVSQDDGFNAYGGKNNMGKGGGPGFDEEDEFANINPNLTINGGQVLVDASGDGLDSNGNLTINGGSIVVYGPTNAGNASLDSGSENGGKLLVNGGQILAVGSAGMAEAFDESSKQCSFIYNLDNEISEGTKVSLINSSNETIYEFTGKKKANSIVFSSDKLKKGDTYKIKIDNEEKELKLESMSNSFGKVSGGMGNPGFGKGNNKGMRQNNWSKNQDKSN